MAMDANKKTQLEQWIVLGLAALFGVIFVVGPMKHLGLFSGFFNQAPPQPQEKVDVSKPIGAIFREQLKMPVPDEPKTTAPILSEREVAPQYTAKELRNPLKSLLPQKQTPSMMSQNPVLPHMPMEPPPPPSPPALRIRGIVWGGSEPKALINDRIYGIGSEVNGVKILSISHQGVTVDYLGKPTLYPADSNLHPPQKGLSRQAEWR